jgi:hypothetical protein
MTINAVKLPWKTGRRKGIFNFQKTISKKQFPKFTHFGGHIILEVIMVDFLLNQSNKKETYDLRE